MQRHHSETRSNGPRLIPMVGVYMGVANGALLGWFMGFTGLPNRNMLTPQLWHGGMQRHLLKGWQGMASWALAAVHALETMDLVFLQSLPNRHPKNLMWICLFWVPILGGLTILHLVWNPKSPEELTQNSGLWIRLKHRKYYTITCNHN